MFPSRVSVAKGDSDWPSDDGKLNRPRMTFRGTWPKSTHMLQYLCTASMLSQFWSSDVSVTMNCWVPASTVIFRMR